MVKTTTLGLVLACCICNVTARRSSEWWKQFWLDFREGGGDAKPRKVFIIPPRSPPPIDISAIDTCLANITTVSNDESTPSFMAREWLLNEDALLRDIVNAGCPRLQQRYALVEFYYALNGTKWYQGHRNFLDGSTSECDWKGVSCDEQDSTTVTSLNFVQVNAKGQLKPSLSALRGLTSLNLQTNLVSGAIPSELFESLTSLKDIVLEGNVLTGVPESVAKLENLQTLNLGNNLIEAFPIAVTELESLEVLSLYENSVSTTIPAQIGAMVGLRRLALGSNEFSGTIPVAIGKLVNLEELDLSDNELSGTFPTEFGNLVRLKKLMLNENNFSGMIPQEFAKMEAITTIRLDNNDLTGAVPSGLCELYKFSMPQSYVDCNDVADTCFTFCCSGGSCVCRFEETDPLRCARSIN